MSRRSTLAILATVTLAALAQRATAQTIAYDHRSTALGDGLAGASELVRAQGAFLKDEAEAAETWVRVASGRDQVHYQRANYRHEVKRMETELRDQKAQSNRDRQESQSAAEVAAARQLYESVQRGGGLWPAALSKPKYAGSMTTVTSLLRNWSPEDPMGDAYRAALATEIGVLKTRVAADTQLDFPSRVEAVRTLKQLQQLTRMTPAELPHAGPERALAMK